MKNVTISMDEQLLRRVKLEAGRAGVSVSRWIAGEIQRAVGDEAEKEAARLRIEKFLAAGPKFDLSENGKINIDRDELYDDGRFRRFDDAALHAGPAISGEAGSGDGVADEPVTF